MRRTTDRLVLVTDGGRGQGRSALAAVRALAAAGWKPVVTASGRWSLAGASRHRAATRQVPAADDDQEAYAEALRREVANGGYDAVVPASDAALVALRSPIAHLLDKAVLAEAAPAAGLAVPPTDVFEEWAEVVAAGPRLEFPMVVKPRRSIEPARAYADVTELRQAEPVDGGVVVQPLLDEPLRSVAGVCHDGRLVAAVHQQALRTWPVPCGTSCAAETVEPDLASEEPVVSLLGDHDGVFQAQFAGPWLLDLNPRVYGSLPLAVAAGANLVAIACELASGGDAPDQVVRGRVGARYRWLDGDVRSVGRRLARGELSVAGAAAALRPHRHTAHSVTTWRDPVPGAERLAHLLLHGRERS